jgi:3-dehydroquinate dehydratase
LSFAATPLLSPLLVDCFVVAVVLLDINSFTNATIVKNNHYPKTITEASNVLSNHHFDKTYNTNKCHQDNQMEGPE